MQFAVCNVSNNASKRFASESAAIEYFNAVLDMGLVVAVP